LENTEVTDKGLEVLRKIPKLKSLNLRRSTAMTDAAMSILKDVPNLQYLSLLYNNITDDGLVELKGLTKLKLLDLRGCVLVTDVGLAHLAKLSNLERLKLRNPNVSDRGVEAIKGLSKLKGLGLEDSQVSDDGRFVSFLTNITGVSQLWQAPVEGGWPVQLTFTSDEMKGDAALRWRALRIRALLWQSGLGWSAQRSVARELRAQLRLKRNLEVAQVARRLFRYWHIFHAPLAQGMYIVVLAHVLQAILLGGSLIALGEFLSSPPWGSH
jgi:hypothetical protein